MARTRPGPDPSSSSATAIGAGHLDHGYPELDVEEDILYAYGFCRAGSGNCCNHGKRPVWGFFEEKVFEAVQHLGETHPKRVADTPWEKDE